MEISSTPIARGPGVPARAICTRIYCISNIFDRGPVGLPQVLGSCGYRHWWVRVVGWPEPLYKVGTESAIIDSATNLKQQIRATSRPSHLL